jgi:hypothetical protein
MDLWPPLGGSRSSILPVLDSLAVRGFVPALSFSIKNIDQRQGDTRLIVKADPSCVTIHGTN